MAGNSTPKKRFYPPGNPLTDPLPHLYQLFYELETQSNNTTSLAINTANSFAAFAANHSNGSGGGGNAAIQFGNHTGRIGSGALVYIETDRNNAVYGNNGTGWGLIEATWAGSFESRYGDLGLNDAGAIWIETSRSNMNAVPPLLQFRWSGNNWGYIEGQISRNQANLSVLFGTLGFPDANMQINVLDYHHQLQWQGSNTTWGPNDDLRAGEGPILREVDPSPTTGWHLYDGSSVNYLNANGSTSSVSLPNLTSGNTFLAAGPNSGPNGPVAPTFTGNPLTPSGTVSKPTLTMDPYTPTGNISGSVSTPNITVANTTLGTGSVVGVGNATVVIQQTHNHAATSDTPSFAGSFVGDSANLTGNVSQPTFTGTPVTPTGSISNNGTPPNLVRKAWFRQ